MFIILANRLSLSIYSSYYCFNFFKKKSKFKFFNENEEFEILSDSLGVRLSGQFETQQAPLKMGERERGREQERDRE